MNVDAAQDRMVEHVDSELAATAAALRAVPRHEFVTDAWLDLAYVDRPLPMGDGQTISAPSIVANACDHLALAACDRTLEIETTSDYRAAVKAEIVVREHVSAVGIDADLAKMARKRLAQLGYKGVSVRVGERRSVFETGNVRRASPIEM